MWRESGNFLIDGPCRSRPYPLNLASRQVSSGRVKCLRFIPLSQIRRQPLNVPFSPQDDPQGSYRRAPGQQWSGTILQQSLWLVFTVPFTGTQCAIRCRKLKGSRRCRWNQAEGQDCTIRPYRRDPSSSWLVRPRSAHDREPRGEGALWQCHGPAACPTPSAKRIPSSPTHLERVFCRTRQAI